MNWREVKEDLLRDPEVKKEYDDLEVEYRLLKAVIENRIRKGLSQEMLARKIGTKQTAIARFESGKTNPSLKFIKKISEALDMDLEINFRPR
ncbi:MAG: helix-turn-helix transcriptional regulator [Firmicutes bacterium]|nr:helix-turn-helix transcriptional regulator [Bacillota bacterium]